MMLNCREMTEYATDYMEGRLGFWMSVRFRAHLLMCRFCSRYLRQMHATIEALRRLPKSRAPDSVKEDLLRRFRDEQR